MRAKVTRVKDLRTVLKDLEGHVKAPAFLRTGKSFKSFPLRPREVLANIFICAVGNHEAGDEKLLTVCTDPLGGDGLILDQKTGRYMTTEHVFVPASNNAELQNVEDRILLSIAHKNNKGHQYARGKDLVVFSEAMGIWYPNRVARRIAGSHAFETVWVIHLDSEEAGTYTYFVSLLDLSLGNAPVWRLRINAQFDDWTVARIQ